jgi:hypothetical protein
MRKRLDDAVIAGEQRLRLRTEGRRLRAASV